MAGIPRVILRDREYLLPPTHDPVRFRKESVASEVHAIAAVVDGFGYSADLAVGFEYKRRDFRSFQQLKRRRQSRRAGTRNYRNFTHGKLLKVRTCRQSYKFQSR